MYRLKDEEDDSDVGIDMGDMGDMGPDMYGDSGDVQADIEANIADDPEFDSYTDADGNTYDSDGNPIDDGEGEESQRSGTSGAGGSSRGGGGSSGSGRSSGGSRQQTQPRAPYPMPRPRRVPRGVRNATIINIGDRPNRPSPANQLTPIYRQQQRGLHSFIGGGNMGGGGSQGFTSPHSISAQQAKQSPAMIFGIGLIAALILLH